MIRLGLQVGQFRHACLHAKRHLVLGDAGLDFRVLRFLKLGAVDGVDAVENRAARTTSNARRIVQIEHRLAGAAEFHALVLGRQEAAPPKPRVKCLTAAASLGDHHDVTRQVVARAAKAVVQPGAHARVTELLRAGVDVGDRWVVVDRLGVDTADE